ncbi:MAG: plasmid partitioning protein RepB [Pseudomonadota bacterium]
MTDSKKKRMSMLDSLANAGAPAPAPSMANNRPLRAARDAVDSHKVWDIDPDDIIDDRVHDRLDTTDIADLRASIEESGQTVPVLLRRHPKAADKYLLVYGRRRLEAIRHSLKVNTIRALIAQMDETKAVEAQITENMGRRDLTYIEKALFAHELIEAGFGNQNRVAEVLTAAKSAISMALGIVGDIGPDLIRSIGPAEGIGRPRWEALAKALAPYDKTPPELITLAERARARESVNTDLETLRDPSVVAFEAVLAKLEPAASPAPQQTKAKSTARTVALRGPAASTLKQTAKGVQINIPHGGFADWLADQAEDVLTELHDRWERRQEGQ